MLAFSCLCRRLKKTAEDTDIENKWWMVLKKYGVFVTKYLFGQDESVTDEVDPWGGGGDVVEAVGGFQLVVGRVRHDSGRQGVERDEVCDAGGAACRWPLHHIGVDDVLSGQKPVLEVLLTEGRHQGESWQMLEDAKQHVAH